MSDPWIEAERLREPPEGDKLSDGWEVDGPNADRILARVRGLQATTAALASAATVEEICGIIVEQAAPRHRSDGERAIWMLGESQLELVAGYGLSKEYPVIPLDSSLPALENLKSGEPLFVESREEMTSRWPVLSDTPTSSFAGLPLVAGTKRLGLMAVGFTDEHHFDPDEREYLAAIAGQASVALARAQELADLEHARSVSESRGEQLDFLAEASRQLSGSLDLDITVATVASLAVPRLTDRCALYLLEGDRIGKQVVAPELNEDESKLFHLTAESLSDASGIGALIRNEDTIHVLDTDDSMLEAEATSPEHLDLMRRVGFGGMLLTVLRARGRGIGALAFVNRDGRPLSAETAGLAKELASRAAVAIDNANLFTHTSTIATRLIHSLLPSALPQIEGLDMAVEYQPGGRGLDVGGDFYDVISLDDGAILLVVGDVQGHGVDAAAMTGILRATIKSASHFRRSPGELLAHLNNIVGDHILESASDPEHPWDSARLCTAVIARLDHHQGGWRCTTAVAGHPLPFVRRADGTVVRLGAHALMLGVNRDVDYRQNVLELAKGDALVLVTDGVLEAPGDSGPFGSQGVTASLSASGGGARHTSSQIAADSLADASAHDDVIVLTVVVES
ncbi:MAG: SpoIIE family protein phosphatase [Acidimicrobiales bacterium]